MECSHVSPCQMPRERRKAQGSCLCQYCLKVSSWWWEAMMATSDCALESSLFTVYSGESATRHPSTEDKGLCQACR